MIAEVMKMREEEKVRSSQDSSMKRFFKKRWVFPAIYIASAAIILTAVLWYQSASNNAGVDNYNYNSSDIAGKKLNEDPAVEVNRSMENFAMPVSNPDDAVIQKQFYDYSAKKEDQEAALVFYNNTYHPNTGIDITTKDGKTFDVVAALSGTVTKVEEDSLLGNVIEVEHDEGIVTQYQSVSDFKVEVGDEVEQGQTLAMAGKSMLNEEAGIHVHFEIRKDSIPVNPTAYFHKSLSDLREANVTEQKPASDDKKATDDGKTDDGAKADDNSNQGAPAEKKAAGEDSPTGDDKSKDGTDKESGSPTDDQTENSSNTNS
jgi:stage II sporulation protein Q